MSAWRRGFESRPTTPFPRWLPYVRQAPRTPRGVQPHSGGCDELVPLPDVASLTAMRSPAQASLPSYSWIYAARRLVAVTRRNPIGAWGGHESCSRGLPRRSNYIIVYGLGRARRHGPGVADLDPGVPSEPPCSAFAKSET